MCREISMKGKEETSTAYPKEKEKQNKPKLLESSGLFGKYKFSGHSG
jgi:hypothetical protein